MSHSSCTQTFSTFSIVGCFWI